jgi:FkbM family methyltransferase
MDLGAGDAALTMLPLPNAEAARTLLHRIAASPAVDAPRHVDKPLTLYGAGNLGRMAKSYFERLNIPVSLAVDANADRHRHASCWQGTPLCTPDEATAEQKATSLLAICIATSPYSDIHTELRAQGWRDIVPFYDIAEAYREHHPLGNGWFAGSLDDRDLSGIENALNRWDDDISRAHHLQFIAWHALREEWRFDGAPVTTNDRYFIPEIRKVLHGQEIFVDGGAHQGEVTLRFAEMMEHRYAQAWLIEADVENLRRCKKAVDHMADTRLLHRAIGDVPGIQGFYPGLGYASQLCRTGPQQIAVTPIDQLGIDGASFIKLHLEGSELAALRGSIQTITAYRPIIAATAYHNHLGLWELPAWFAEQLPGYTLLFRAHGWCGTGAVIYAIPAERHQKPIRDRNKMAPLITL